LVVYQATWPCRFPDLPSVRFRHPLPFGTRLPGTFVTGTNRFSCLPGSLQLFSVPLEPAVRSKNRVRQATSQKKSLDRRFATGTKASMGLFRRRKPLMSFPTKDYVVSLTDPSRGWPGLAPAFIGLCRFHERPDS